MQGENERQWHFLQETFRKKCFWNFHVEVVQNNGKEIYKKSVLHMQSCFFAN